MTANEPAEPRPTPLPMLRAGIFDVGRRSVWLGDAVLLQAAGADLMMTSLDEIDLAELAYGRLCRRGG